MPAEFKTCPYCLESMNGEAQKCPHCLMWVKRKGMVIRGLLLLVVVALIGFTFSWPLSRFGDPFRSGHMFYEYSDLLSITDLKWHVATDENGYKGTRLFVTGVIHNKSNLTWDFCRLEVVMKNAKGDVIDVIQEKDFPIISPRKSNVMFRVQHIAARTQEEYASGTARVLWADEHTRPWF
jgi:hypothetical protein